MAYSKQTWSSNELITADKLNHIEDGIPTKTSQLTNDSGFLTSHQSIAGKKNTQSAISSPSASGTAVAFIDNISQDAQGVITPTKKTVATVTTSAAGLMSAEDKTKLDGIAAGAAVTSVNNQIGAVSVTPSNIGAVNKTGDTIKNPTADTATSLFIKGTKSSGSIELRCDHEGGNIDIGGPNGSDYFEIDAYNNTSLRCFKITDGSYKEFSFNGLTGVLSADGGFAGTAKLPTLISSSVLVTASIPFDLSAYSRIECDFNATGNRGHFVLQDKDEWYCLSFLTEGTATSDTLNMYAIRAKYTDNGIEVNYCGFKNLSTGVWNNRLENSGYTLRNIYGYV